jgi:DNA-binding transcriptional MocR family regulator
VDGTISFAGDGPSPDLVPVDELAECSSAALEADGDRILSYGTGAGYTPLRELIAEQLEVHPFRVLITNGWLQGFRLLLQGRVRAQTVVIEYPTYLPALQSVFYNAASVLYLDVREEGPDVEQLNFQVRTNPAKLAYLIPTFHNPTGWTMSEQERLDIGGILYRSKVLIVEDDTYGPLRFEGDPIPTVFALSQKTSIYSASLSTPVAPGLRVGVFVVPDEVAGPLAALANSTYITPVLLGQATLFEFMRRGAYESHLEELRGNLLERRDAAIAALDEHFEGCVFSRPEGGFFTLLQLPRGYDAKELLERANGVEAVAGGDLMGHPGTIRLNFAAPALDEIEPGIARLAEAWKGMEEPPEL